MTIPFEDLGGAGPLVHFAHANGYPPGAYAPLLAPLTERYHVLAMAARPLWPAPVDGLTPAALRDWTPFTTDLLGFLEARSPGGWIGMGHSLGAVNTLDAALRRPELFRALVLIDPVIFRRRFMWGWHLMKTLGVGDRVHPLIQGSLRRRRVFASADEMFSRYRRAPIFSRLTDASLRAYVDALARPRSDGRVELAFSPEWEAAIYRHGPLNLWARLPALRLPLLVIYGAESDTFVPTVARRLQRLLPHARLVAVPDAGHLVPLEKPAEVAAAAVQFLEDQLGLGAA